jgi:hypothetical protein
MADEKSHTEQGQIERAERLRKVIDDLKEGRTPESASGQAGSLKEQIDERAADEERNSQS